VRIIAHDEDSMTNLFFSEVHRHERLEKFLALIEWRNSPVMPFDVAEAELHQQVNFSEFGRPDAIILVTDGRGRKHVVIVEVKLGTYLDSCELSRTGKFDNRFNSRLNNQLALKYRAMVSLPSILEWGYITESEHAADSPYFADQVRRCKKASTIALFRDIAEGGAKWYLVTLTSDAASPTSEERLASTDPCFPLFFDQHLETQQEYRNLGSALWSRCGWLFDGLDTHIGESLALHFGNAAETEQAGEAASPTPADLFVKGRQIVDFAGKTCHLSCRGYSFAIRHLRDGEFVEIYRGRNDREKYLGLRGQLGVLDRAPQTPLTDIPFWESYFRAFDADRSGAGATS
jgi:hypothetical protein